MDVLVVLADIRVVIATEMRREGTPVNTSILARKSQPPKLTTQ